MLGVLKEINNAIDKDNTVVVVCFDISATFDTIHHARLLERLRNEFGVNSCALNWLQSYISGRTQFIKCEQSSSTQSACSSGMPQGSVLGPLLFSAYTSPIGNFIAESAINYHLYADDIQLYIAVDPKNTAPVLQ